MSLLVCMLPECQTSAGCTCSLRPPYRPVPIELTPIMIKAAWHEARRWWPHQVVETRPCKACGQSKGWRVKETGINVPEPAPGFREALQAALRAGGHGP